MLLELAASLICAYAPGRDCQIANSGRVEMGVQFADTRQGEYLPGRKLIRLAPQTQPAVLASAWIHEIQHQKDDEAGRPVGCASENGAYTVQIAFFDWANDTFGPAINADRFDTNTNFMNSYVHREADFVFRAMSFNHC